MFDQRVDPHGFYLSPVTLVGTIHAPTAAGLSHLDPVGRPITAPVKPLLIHQRFNQKGLHTVMPLPVAPTDEAQ